MVQAPPFRPHTRARPPLVQVTPDGQRTMRTCLCASLELNAPGLLPPGLAPQGGLLHCEGYTLYRPAVAEAAMRAARAAGGRVSLDLASFEVVRSCFGALLGLLRQALVDLLFCNEQEAAALCRVSCQPMGEGGCSRCRGACHLLEADASSQLTATHIQPQGVR